MTVENSERDGNIRPPTCLLRNLYAGQEATELDMEQQTGSKLGKGDTCVRMADIHPSLFT